MKIISNFKSGKNKRSENENKDKHKKGLFNFNQKENAKKKEITDNIINKNNDYYSSENKNIFYEKDFYEFPDFERGDIIIEETHKIYDNIKKENNYKYNENNEIKLLNFSQSKKNNIEEARELRNLFKSFIMEKQISFHLEEIFETV
jgi:hypothetical protein